MVNFILSASNGGLLLNTKILIRYKIGFTTRHLKYYFLNYIKVTYNTQWRLRWPVLLWLKISKKHSAMAVSCIWFTSHTFRKTCPFPFSMYCQIHFYHNTENMAFWYIYQYIRIFWVRYHFWMIYFYKVNL